MLKRIRNLLGRGKKPAAESPVSARAPEVHRGPRIVHRPIDREDLDPDAVKIIQRLTRFDHRAYLVGGCVRDLLLELRPKDFDIGTSATPRQIKRAFRNCRIIGRRFRLAHIYFQNGKIIEVATFRAQDGADNGQGETDLLIRDDNLFGTPEEDALRRDFTINALFYDVNEGNVLDHTDGLDDLRRRRIHTIGDPEIRFREDPIRILRAIRFAGRLDFEIEKETLAALERTADQIPKAAAPRILEEINRICGGGARRAFELLESTGVFAVILPELARHYADHRASWSLLLDLLASVDRRTQEGDYRASTGKILAILLLPVIGERMGWRDDGTVEPLENLDLREVVDGVLRPLALRLRVPRKDQEHCRQILLSLQRMVPVSRLRRHDRRSVLQRDCLPDALAILEVLGQRPGGAFAEAYTYWTEAASTTTAGEKQPERSSPRRRGRRGGRGRRSTSGGGERSPARKPRQEAPARPAKPRNWNDDYFFDALPSVPELAGDDPAVDRYGASSIAPVETPVETPDAAPEKTPEQASGAESGDREAPRPRRRRRRRRRGGARKSDQGGSDGGGTNDGDRESS